MAGEVERSQAQFEKAITHFERAAVLNPDSVQTHFLLARTYDDMHNPEFGIDAPAARAIQEYQRVIQLDPHSADAIKYLAYLYLTGARYADSEKYYRMALAGDPNDVEALYSIAFINWRTSYQLRMETLSSLEKKSLFLTQACAEVRRQNLGRVNEGIHLLERAAQSKKDVDIMAYANLLYLERADIQCQDPSAHKSDVSAAKYWRDLVIKDYCEQYTMSISRKWPPVAPSAPPPPPNQTPKCD